MKFRNYSLKIKLRRIAASASAAAFMISCFTIGAQAEAVKPNAPRTSLDSGTIETISESQIVIHDDTLDKNITSAPYVYLDNTDSAGGAVSTTVTVYIADRNGALTADVDEELAYEISDPNGCIDVRSISEEGGSKSVTLDIRAYKTQDGVNVPLNAGSASISFTNKKRTVNRVLRCTVYAPSSDMNIYWNGSSEPLELNDFCPDNSTELQAVTNHTYRLSAAALPEGSADRVEWSVCGGTYVGELGETPEEIPEETSIASITEDGVFTAIDEGDVTIIAKFAETVNSSRDYAYGFKELYAADNSDHTLSAYVKTVPKYIHVHIKKENPISKISFTDIPDSLKLGETFEIKYDSVSLYADAGLTETTDSIRWTSSDPSVIEVTQDGIITAVGSGKATITACGENPDVYAEHIVRSVKTAEVISIINAPSLITANTPVEITAQLLPEDANDEIIWSCSDESIATVTPSADSSGSVHTAVLNGLSEGTATITAAAVNSDIFSQFSVTVQPRISFNELILSYSSGGSETTVSEGGTLNLYTNQDLTINARLFNDLGEQVNDAVSWEITNNNSDYVTIPTQTSAKLVLHGSSEGTIIVKAYADSDKSVSRTFYVQVLKACDHIGFTDINGKELPEYKSINVGALFPMRAKLTIDGNYPSQHSDKVVAWESSDPEKAQVDGSGNVRAVSNGDAVITVRTASGKEASKRVYIFTTSQVIMTNVQASTDGTLPKAYININENGEGSYQLNARIKNQYGENVSNADAEWSSSDENIATVSSTGVVTAVGLGKATITVKSGSKSDQCDISVCAPLSIAEIADIPSQLYSPIKQVYEPKPVVSYKGSVLVEGTDYTLDYSENMGIGTGRVIIKGMGNFSQTVTKFFEILPRSINDHEMTILIYDHVKCTGSPLTPPPEVYCMGITLSPDTDYSVSYMNNTYPGTASVSIRCKGNYTGEIALTFEIYCDHEDKTEPVITKITTCGEPGTAVSTCNICHQKIEEEIAAVPHSFVEEVIPPTRSERGYTLHTCTVCGYSYADNYVAQLEGISILNCRAMINGNTFTYTGEPITPPVTIWNDDKPLAQNADYIVNYYNNTEVGEAYAIITGIGDYKDIGKITFYITSPGSTDDARSTDTEAELVTTDCDTDTDDGRISISRTETIQLDSRVFSPENVPFEPKPIVTLSNGNAMVENVDYTLAYANNSSVGTATILMTGIGKYKGIARFEFEILPKPLTDADVAVTAINRQTCTGKALKPIPTVTCGNYFLGNRKDYKITYSSNTYPGLATATITGLGNFTGTLTVNFLIECNHDYHEQTVPPTYSARGYTLHTCSICGAVYRDNYVDQLQSTNISDCDVTLEYKTAAFTGEPLTPNITVTNNSGLVLDEGLDYTVEYSNNTDPGLANINISGIGAYTGLKMVNFQIINRLYGDVNSDGIITSEDALMALRYTVKLETLNDQQYTAADVNKDGSVKADDSLSILRYTVGLRDDGTIIGTT